MKHDSPLTLRIAMVIGLGFGIPLIATGLVPLAFGVLVLASPNQLAESGFYGAGFTLAQPAWTGTLVRSFQCLGKALVVRLKSRLVSQRRGRAT